MALLAVNVICTTGGSTTVSVNFESTRSGGSNDRAAIRVLRRIAGYSDYALPSAPEFLIFGDKDIRSWTFIDSNLPFDAVFSYVLQIRRIEGGGSFGSMLISAVHYRK